MVLAKLDVWMYKNKLDFLPLIICKKINSGCIKDLNLRARMLTFLEEKIQDNFGDYFLKKKSTSNKSKTRKMGVYETQKLYRKNIFN